MINSEIEIWFYAVGNSSEKRLLIHWGYLGHTCGYSLNSPENLLEHWQSQSRGPQLCKGLGEEELREWLWKSRVWSMWKTVLEKWSGSRQGWRTLEAQLSSVLFCRQQCLWRCQSRSNQGAAFVRNVNAKPWKQMAFLPAPQSCGFEGGKAELRLLEWIWQVPPRNRSWPSSVNTQLPVHFPNYLISEIKSITVNSNFHKQFFCLYMWYSSSNHK